MENTEKNISAAEDREREKEQVCAKDREGRTGKKGAFYPSLRLEPLRHAAEGSTGGCVEAHLRLSRLREAKRRAEWMRERVSSLDRRFLPLQNTENTKVDTGRDSSITEDLAEIRLEMEEKLRAAEKEYAGAYTDCCELLLAVTSGKAREALTLVYLECMRAQDAADRMEISLSGFNSYKREGLKEIQKTLV